MLFNYVCHIVHSDLCRQLKSCDFSGGGAEAEMGLKGQVLTQGSQPHPSSCHAAEVGHSYLDFTSPVGVSFSKF